MLLGVMGSQGTLQLYQQLQARAGMDGRGPRFGAGVGGVFRIWLPKTGRHKREPWEAERSRGTDEGIHPLRSFSDSGIKV